LTFNHRPISLLSGFSKILEKIVYNRLYSFLIKSNIFSNSQFGFKDIHPTSQLSTLLIDKITERFERKHINYGNISRPFQNFRYHWPRNFAK